MNEQVFRNKLTGKGFGDPQIKRWQPDLDVEMHTHEQEIMLLITDGQLSLVKADRVEVYNPGESCVLDAGTVHAERTDARGATGLIAFRSV